MEFLRLWPLSLAEKCRLTFGTAVILILIIALLLPYVWMGQLTKKGLLDANRAKAEALLLRLHFQLKDPREAERPVLDRTGAVIDVNNPEIEWVRFTKDDEEKLALLDDYQREKIETLKTDEAADDNIRLTRTEGVLRSDYVRIVRATDNCISCHNPQLSVTAYSLNEPIGAVLIRSHGIGSELSKTALLNLVWVVVAGLIGGTGAIVAFYWITQRVILRPIRQLRALANNVAEGNLDIRSSIATRDEYEKLADAFNKMLDALQAAHEKLRQANEQLDAKIVELSERNIELYRANKVKSEFLANMSHEFRTPLNAILGFAQVLREKPGLLKKDKAQRYAENIITSGNNLLNMINDLLDLAKTQAGRMELHLEQASLQEICSSVVASFSLITRRKRIRVKMNTASDIPPLFTDAGKVRQILYNFLSNAVKFTPPRGTVQVAAAMVDEKTVRISVSDTGCGIPQQDREKIFDKFRQLDGSITRQSPGSGLGLAICKELTAMLAGTIDLESTLDEGSTFWIDIPVTLTTEQARTS